MNDTDSKRRQLIHVAILSAIGLAVELLLIRWLDSQVRALSYVKNLTLIASFLGLGIGYASVGRKPRFVPFAVILISLLIGLGTFLASEAGDRLQAGPATTEANLGVRVATSSMEVATFCAVIAIVFFAVTIALVPLGQLTGEYLVGLEPVQSYTANIFGSLAGVLLVFAVSSLSVPPWITMTFCVIVTLGYIWRRNRFAILSALTALIALAGMAALDHQPERITVWSPYNRIEATKLPVEAGANAPHGWMLRVQNLFYQQIIDLSPQMTSRYGHLKNIQKAAYEYNFPYVWKRPPGEVLVLGAGTGNDVAAALRAGATRVDAVEIDPRIVDLGRELHGEKPYSDPRVHVIVTDARAYMKSTPRRYDMIVFGLLDAHTSFYSSLTGGIRLDNYVYTVESFEQALALLKPNGLLALSFYVEQPWIATRMGQMMRDAQGSDAMVSRIASNTYTFLAGPGAPLQGPTLSRGIPSAFAQEFPAGPRSTDDWPFIYLRGKAIPPMLIAASVAIALVTALVVFFFFRGETRFNRHFFFLGAGFLLLETRTIAQLALLFGTTWRVSAIAIAAILAMILLANLIVLRRGGFPLAPLYGVLALALLVNFFAPASSAVGQGVAAAIGMTVLLAVPLFLAALIFASSISKENGIVPVLAANLVGAVLGGLLENTSLIFGISALNFVALALYLLSMRRLGRAV